MFRIEFFCDDKKVGDALRGLMGIAVGAPAVTPVINAEVQEGKIKAKTNGKLVNQFIAHIQQSKVNEIRPKEVGIWLKSIGMSSLSASYVLRLACDMRILRKTGGSISTVYHVVRALPAPKKGAKYGEEN